MAHASFSPLSEIVQKFYMNSSLYLSLWCKIPIKVFSKCFKVDCYSTLAIANMGPVNVKSQPSLRGEGCQRYRYTDATPILSWAAI